MKLIKDVLISVLISFNYFSFFYMFFRFDIGKISIKKTFISLAICLISFALFFFDFKPINEIWMVGFLVFFSIGLILFDISIWSYLKYSVITYLAFNNIFSSVRSIIVESELMTITNCEWFLCLLFPFVAWLLYLFILRSAKKDRFYINGYLWLPIIVFLFFFRIWFSYFNYMTVYHIRFEGHVFLSLANILSNIGMIVINVALFLFIYLINRENELKLKQELDNAFNAQRREYFEEIAKKDRLNRKMLHDRKSEILYIGSLLERSEYSRIKEYLTQVDRSIDFIRNYDYNVGNTVVNVILNHYLKQLSTNVSISVRGMISDDIPIADRDMCILISNIVRNAVEEIKDIEDRSFFELEIWTNNNELTVRTRNSINPARRKGVQKKGRHSGLGLSNISDVIDKYGGNCGHSIDDNTFEFSIIIPL